MSTSRKTARRKTTSGTAKTATNNWPPQSVLEPGDGHLWVPTVAFDFHEVVVSYLEGFATFVNLSYPGANMNPATARFYHPGYDPEVGLSPVEFERAFATFAMAAPGGYGSLPAIGNIKEQMQRIRDAGIRIKILTWVPGAAGSVTPVDMDKNPLHSGIAQRVTLDLIEKLGLPVDIEHDVEFIHTGQKPFHMGRKRIPLIVEDNEATCALVAQLAHAAILVPKPYNEGFACRNVLRLNDHSEIADTVIAFFEALRSRGLVLERR